MTAPKLTVQRRVARWSEQLVEELGATVHSAPPTFLIADRSADRRAHLDQLIRRTCTEPQIHRAGRDIDALRCSATDVWAAFVHLPALTASGIELGERLAFRYPHATLLGYSTGNEPRVGALFVAGVEHLVRADELSEAVPALVRAALIRRRTLFDGLVHRELSRKVTAELGPAVARSLGLSVILPDVKPMDRARRDALLAAMRRSQGNKTLAADLLGVSRQTVTRWLKQLDDAEA